MIDSSDSKQVHDLYQKMGAAALSKIRYLIAQPGLGEDILHDVFTRFWTSGIIFESEGQAFKWIYQSCHNAAIDSLRRDQRKNDYEQKMRQCGYVEDHSYQWLEVKGDLRRVLGQLDEKDAQILVYRHVDQMTQEEIADFLDISRSTVVRSLQRSRQQLDTFEEVADG